MNRNAVLCVDDDAAILMGLRQELTATLGNELDVEIAHSAEEALQLMPELCEGGYEKVIVISDWMMPGMRGDELLTRLHRQHTNVITVLLSGQADDDAVEQATVSANLYTYIRKPWQSSDLNAVIQMALGLRPRPNVAMGC
jgi:DNA-binding NtrC family response regulator